LRSRRGCRNRQLLLRIMAKRAQASRSEILRGAPLLKPCHHQGVEPMVGAPGLTKELEERGRLGGGDEARGAGVELALRGGGKQPKLRRAW
jgi:hypothetical protein